MHINLGILKYSAESLWDSLAHNKIILEHTEEVSVLVDGEDVDAAGGQGLLSAVGHAVGLGDDPALARRDDVLPIGIDADTQHARIVMSTQFTHTEKKKKWRKNTIRFRIPNVQQTFATAFHCVGGDGQNTTKKYGTRSSEQIDAGRFETLNSVIYPLSSVYDTRAHNRQKAVAERKDESARA